MTKVTLKIDKNDNGSVTVRLLDADTGAVVFTKAAKAPQHIGPSTFNYKSILSARSAAQSFVIKNKLELV